MESDYRDRNLPAIRTLRRRAVMIFLLAFSPHHVAGQTLRMPSEMSPGCVDSNQKAMADVARGRLAEAQVELGAALTAAPEGTPCRGLVLHNMATVASLSGRFADGERLAMRSLSILEKIYPPDDVALLRPLQVLISTRIEQGKKSAARDAFPRLKAIRAGQPEQRAMIHGITGALFQWVDDRRQAEVEYRAALDYWTESGQGGSSQAAAVLMSLGTLYVEDRRYEDARQSLDRASTILARSEETSPMDYVKLHGVRGAMHASQKQWLHAESAFYSALSLAERQADADSGYVIWLLTKLAEALKKNGRRKEGQRMEARATALGRTARSNMVVELSDLVVPQKSAKE